MTATFDSMNRIDTVGGGGRTMVSGTLDEPGLASIGLQGEGERPARMLPGNRFEAEIDLPAGESTLAVEASDESGNRSSYLYSVETDPQTGRSFTYDDDGNLTSDGVRSYEWDALARLKKITWETGKTTEFTYNPLGQRYKAVEKIGTQTTTRYYLYDGADLVERRTSTAAYPTADSATTDRRYFDQGEHRWNGTDWVAYHYCRDYLGSVREVLTGEGTLVARYDYSPYGERIMRYQDASYGPCEFGFTGHLTLQSPVTGQGDLVLAFYRAYDPASGCWLSEDPLGLEGGINLYAYLEGGPLDNSDPLGLWGLAWGQRDGSGYSFKIGIGHPSLIFSKETFTEDLPQGASVTADTFIDGFTFGAAASPLAKAGFYDPCDKTMQTSRKIAEVGVITSQLALGGAAGLRAAGAKAAGKEFSHWIPDRLLKRTGSKWLRKNFGMSRWNGNYVSSYRHYLHDPKRFPKGWRSFGDRLPFVLRQIDRIPRSLGGLGIGGASGGASISVENTKCDD